MKSTRDDDDRQERHSRAGSSQLCQQHIHNFDTGCLAPMDASDDHRPAVARSRKEIGLDRFFSRADGELTLDVARFRRPSMVVGTLLARDEGVAGPVGLRSILRELIGEPPVIGSRREVSIEPGDQV